MKTNQRRLRLLLLCFPLLTAAAAKDGGPAYPTEKLPYADALTPGKLTVVASFDGSQSLERWAQILEFARANGVKFTFFASGVHFVPTRDKNIYINPRQPDLKGQSIIGFGGLPESVEERKAVVLQAVQEGHDIESHLNGHFSGLHWDEDAWRREFDQFKTFTHFLPRPAAHVRFPLLALNSHVYSVLAEEGYKSIVSVDKEDFKTFRRVLVPAGGTTAVIYEFPIPYKIIKGIKLLFMDYNFYVYDTARHKTREERVAFMRELYLEEAGKCFQEKRPFFINHHFTNWVEGAYWEALQDVIVTLNKTYPVEYITVSQLTEKISLPPAQRPAALLGAAPAPAPSPVAPSTGAPATPVK